MAIYVQPFPTTGATYPLFVRRQPANGPANTPRTPTGVVNGRHGALLCAEIGGLEVVRITMQPRFAFGQIPFTLLRAFNPRRTQISGASTTSPRTGGSWPWFRPSGLRRSVQRFAKYE